MSWCKFHEKLFFWIFYNLQHHSTIVQSTISEIFTVFSFQCFLYKSVHFNMSAPSPNWIIKAKPFHIFFVSFIEFWGNSSKKNRDCWLADIGCAKINMVILSTLTCIVQQSSIQMGHARHVFWWRLTVCFDDDIFKIDVLCLHWRSVICAQTPRSGRTRSSLSFRDFPVSEGEIKKGGKMRHL